MNTSLHARHAAIRERQEKLKARAAPYEGAAYRDLRRESPHHARRQIDWRARAENIVWGVAVVLLIGVLFVLMSIAIEMDRRRARIYLECQLEGRVVYSGLCLSREEVQRITSHATN